MNLLDFIGLCEVRRAGVGYPSRKTLCFVNAVVSDNAPRSRTQVQVSSSLAPWVATLGDNDWSDALDDTRFYDAGAGAWFARAAQFSAAGEIFLSTHNDTDVLVIRSMPGPPLVQRKLLVNLGPGEIFLAATDTAPNTFRIPASSDGRVQSAVKLTWDAVDGRWLPFA